MSYDDDTVKAVRLLALDPDVEDTSPVFDDTEITLFLNLQGGDPTGATPVPRYAIKRAAAAAVDVIASNEVLVLKRITDHQLSTDGPAEATALRKHADALRAEADVDEEKSDDGSFFDIIAPTCW